MQQHLADKKIFSLSSISILLILFCVIVLYLYKQNNFAIIGGKDSILYEENGCVVDVINKTIIVDISLNFYNREVFTNDRIVLDCTKPSIDISNIQINDNVNFSFFIDEVINNTVKVQKMHIVNE